MIRHKEVLGSLIVVGAVAAVLVYFAARAFSAVALLHTENAQEAAMSGGLAGVDTSGWRTYTDQAFGFSFRYPPNWRLSTFGLSSEPPFIVLGNPLTGTTTYAMYISPEQNPHELSSGEFVHQMLAADRAQDIASGAASGTAPTVTPHFSSAYFTRVGAGGAYDAYELYGVFEFDHSGEQIYVAHGTAALIFDFPVADANPNLSSPANNNAIAHMIVGTLTFE